MSGIRDWILPNKVTNKREGTESQGDAGEAFIIHTVQRCVRTAVVAGRDDRTGFDHSYCGEWISNISWFMQAQSEPIARLANKQDGCTGRFWGGRFWAQRIVDEAGLLAYSMHVDLNPVRAALADSPDGAVYTSAYDRIKAEQGEQIASAAFDLVSVTSEQAGEHLWETSVADRKRQRRAKRQNPTGKQILRDFWLAPLIPSDRNLAESQAIFWPQHLCRFA